MDTINHQISNNPDDDNMKEVVTAQDVALNMLNNQVPTYDINDLMDIETQAELARELIGIWASREPRCSLISMCLNMVDQMESAITNAAISKGYHE
jgi:hypothetical protein